jgi:dTDP-4-amino-4,6-dideoxygalactose transaminase
MIPFLDLVGQYRQIKEEIDEAIARVLNSGQFVLGSEVAGFEEEFAAYCQAKHAVALNSGTSALHLALLAAGIGPGDDVLTVSHTFVATAAAILYAGARPIFVDVDPVSYTMDPGRIEAALTPRTRAIIPVHLYGQPAELEPILEIARRRQIVLIEDAAQAHGAEYHGRRVGALGDIGCFSFYPGKNLGAYGEGGCVVTNNPAYAKAVRVLRDWGQEVRYRHVRKGYNYRLEAIQGAILRVKLRHLERWTELRRSLATAYDRLLAGAGVICPRVLPERRHVFHIYAIRCQQRDALQQALRDQNLQTGIHYPIPVHLQPAYADLGYKAGDFPTTEAIAAEELSLPLFPELTEEQVAQVADAVQKFQRGV